MTDIFHITRHKSVYLVGMLTTVISLKGNKQFDGITGMAYYGPELI